MGVSTLGEQSLQDDISRTDKTGSIQFTRQDEHENRLPVLDVRLTRTEDRQIEMTVYRKATQTEQ